MNQNEKDFSEPTAKQAQFKKGDFIGKKYEVLLVIMSMKSNNKDNAL